MSDMYSHTNSLSLQIHAPTAPTNQRLQITNLVSFSDRELVDAGGSKMLLNEKSACSAT